MITDKDKKSICSKSSNWTAQITYTYKTFLSISS